jgi:2-dehydropantoate 2-reductase
MKIAMVGCGAVGTYYGAQLARSGADIHFLLRSDYAVVVEHGVHIRSVQENLEVRPSCARAPEEIGHCDLVLVALKTTAAADYSRLLSPLLAPGTVIATLQNGLGNEERLSALFPGQPIIGGMCFVCLNRVAPGVVVHLDHGHVVVGDFKAGGGKINAAGLCEMIRATGVSCTVAQNLAKARWEKLVWNIPFNGLGVASAAGLQAVVEGRLPPGLQLGSCLTTDRLLTSPEWRGLVCELMAEVVRAAGALGFEIPMAFAHKQVERTGSMGAYKASTLIDFEEGRPLELDSIFLEPLRRGTRAGEKMPRLTALCSVLEALDRQRRSQSPTP